MCSIVMYKECREVNAFVVFCVNLQGPSMHRKHQPMSLRATLTWRSPQQMPLCSSGGGFGEQVIHYRHWVPSSC
jgi:hypothetical protein